MEVGDEGAVSLSRPANGVVVVSQAEAKTVVEDSGRRRK